MLQFIKSAKKICPLVTRTTLSYHPEINLLCLEGNLYGPYSVKLRLTLSSRHRNIGRQYAITAGEPISKCFHAKV